MRAPLHRLLMIRVFCCGLHVAPQVQGQGVAVHHKLEHSAGPGDPEAGTLPAEPADPAHHECPAAPDQSFDSCATCAMMPSLLLLFAAPAVQLTSLSQAPPLEAPAA